jgi:hypothetical protein
MAPRKVKQTQKQKQKQTVIVNIEQPKAKPRKKRAPRRKPEQVELFREFPKVVYVPSPLTIYGDRLPEDTRPSITKPTETPKKTPILEDLGIVGEGKGVEILDVPTKKEQLAELITPVALAEDSGRAIARSTVEPTDRMRLPDDKANRFITKESSGSEMSFRSPSVSSVSNVSSEKSFRFPEPKTFRYSDIERLGPSPYGSELSVGSGGFSGSESDAPSRFSGNVFMEQQADFMRQAQKQYKEKQEKPESKAKMRIQFPEEEGGYLTGVTQSTTAPKPRPPKAKRGKRNKETEGLDFAFGLAPSPDFTGPFPKTIIKEISKKPPSKMNKTELENTYKRLRGEAPPNMSNRDLFKEVRELVSR